MKIQILHSIINKVDLTNDIFIFLYKPDIEIILDLINVQNKRVLTIDKLDIKLPKLYNSLVCLGGITFIIGESYNDIKQSLLNWKDYQTIVVLRNGDTISENIPSLLIIQNDGKEKINVNKNKIMVI